MPNHTQTSVGRLVSLSVDNPKYYTQEVPSSARSTPPPPLIPIASAAASSMNNDDEEKTMLWHNVATLFSKFDNIESEVEKQRHDTVRCTDDVYQELQYVKGEISQVQTGFNDVLVKHGRKLRKYVNKKCEKVRASVSYSAYDADNEVFAYVDKTRDDFESRTKKLEDEITSLKMEMKQLNETYNQDYELFIERENDMMAKLDAAVKMNEATNNRMKDMEEFFMRQIQQARNYADTHVAGDLREEFSTAICREITFESKVSAQLVQSVNDELTGLITQSNEYHSARYFGTVEEMNQLRETCQTLKQSIGMVDDELSYTKEKFDTLKDDVYHELDRDYYDLKNYVKRKVHNYHKPPVQEDVTTLLIDENTVQATTNDEEPIENDENVVIIDENMVIIEDEVQHT
jgi:sugar-specific transcriptional regulator TrmB